MDHERQKPEKTEKKPSRFKRAKKVRHLDASLSLSISSRCL